MLTAQFSFVFFSAALPLQFAKSTKNYLELGRDRICISIEDRGGESRGKLQGGRFAPRRMLMHFPKRHYPLAA
jgi:hypothetical protein